jgi:hypothetical protein
MILKNRMLSLGGSDLSSLIESATVTQEYDEVDATHDGASAHYGEKGLATWSIEVQLRQSFAAGALDSIMWPIVNSDAPVAVVTKPVNADTSTSNPKFTGQGHIYGYTPFSGATGEKASTSFTIKCGDGNLLARTTSDS